MTIEEKYRFSDFTLSNYKNILKMAINKGYKFKLFDILYDYPQRSIILRHDLEFSVPIALEMAKIEYQLGIKSTFFIQLHGDFYNALEINTFNIIKEIESFGHEIALHFDTHFWDIKDTQQLEQFLLIDKDTFTKYFGKAPRLFSFHNNNAFTMTCEQNSYGGMHNVYATKYKKEYGYCADSTGFWRYEILEQRINEAKDNVLQVLIHDAMWQDTVLPPRRRVYRTIDEHASFMKKKYDETLLKFGAKNIDWEGEV
tara:strand:- start:19365 stop:20132 length:768 start_codon:yes stop_codon:yes gene_type:complete